MEFSLEEVSKHCTKDDLYVVLNGRVYNLTEFLEHHPGGVAPLIKGAGRDVTEYFNKIAKHSNSDKVALVLEKYFIGTISN